MGDFVLTSAAIHTIRENFPSAHITFVVSKMIADLAKFAQKNLWQRRFDVSFYLGIVMRPVRNFLSYLSGAKERICFDTDELTRYFNTKYIPILPEYYEHDCLMNLHLLRQVSARIFRKENIQSKNI